MNSPSVTGLFLRLVFIGWNVNLETARMPWGVSPIQDCREFSPAQVSGLEECQLNAGLRTGIIIAANHRLMAGVAGLAARSTRGHRWSCAELPAPFPTTPQWHRAWAG